MISAAETIDDDSPNRRTTRPNVSFFLLNIERRSTFLQIRRLSVIRNFDSFDPILFSLNCVICGFLLLKIRVILDFWSVLFGFIFKLEIKYVCEYKIKIFAVFSYFEILAIQLKKQPRVTRKIFSLHPMKSKLYSSIKSKICTPNANPVF